MVTVTEAPGSSSGSVHVWTAPFATAAPLTVTRAVVTPSGSVILTGCSTDRPSPMLVTVTAIRPVVPMDSA